MTGVGGALEATCSGVFGVLLLVFGGFPLLTATVFGATSGGRFTSSVFGVAGLAEATVSGGTLPVAGGISGAASATPSSMFRSSTGIWKYSGGM